MLLAADHLDHGGALHGAGRQFTELARAFGPDRIQATACILHPPSELGEQLLREGMPLHFWGHRSWNPIHLWHFVRFIREHRIDVLHLTDFGASTYGRIAARLTRTPAVVHVRSHHSEYQPRGYPPYVAWVYRILAPWTARAIAISESVGQFAVQRMGFQPRQVEVLNNPLAEYSFAEPSAEQVRDLRRRHGFGAGDPIVGTVTRFHTAKGIRFLLQALPAVLREEPHAWLVLVGEGPREPALAALATELGIADRVIFAGFQREVQTFFGMFDVSVVPSLEEGFGNVALESLALGVPVVASAIGGLPEIVTDGETGFLVEPGDPGEIARAVLQILQNPRLRARMSRAAREKVQRFTMESYVENLERIYSSVAQSSRRG